MRKFGINASRGRLLRQLCDVRGLRFCYGSSFYILFVLYEGFSSEYLHCCVETSLWLTVWE
jgi:hypothetical protein